jgi:uncharacterized protein YjbI with pentapeptide repeats
LTNADFKGANLKGTNLSGANLRFTDLRFADLRGADLSGADLRFADLRFADLRFANFRHTIYNENTIFPDRFDRATPGLLCESADAGDRGSCDLEKRVEDRILSQFLNFRLFSCKQKKVS